MVINVIENEKGWVNVDTLPIQIISHKTRLFLSYLQHKYDVICIHDSHPLIPHSISFPFGPEYSVFGLPNKEAEKETSPPIWNITNIFVKSSCGNSHQRQIPDVTKSGFSKGTYKFNNENWFRLYENYLTRTTYSKKLNKLKL